MEKKRIAIHEAGHLTVCFRLGWEVKNIKRTENSPYSLCYEKNGIEYYVKPQNDAQKEHNFERICIAWGGGIMEEREFGDLWMTGGKKSVYGDEETVKKLIYYNKEEIRYSQKAMRQSDIILQNNRTIILKIFRVVQDFLNNPSDFNKHKLELNKRFKSN